MELLITQVGPPLWAIITFFFMELNQLGFYRGLQGFKVEVAIAAKTEIVLILRK
jgi:hypothetical protein